MTRLAAFKKEARESCTWRGHKMGSFKTHKHSERSATAVCKVCGPAVALGCPMSDDV